MLLDGVEDTVTKHRNVFYFCKFDRVDSRNGEETLMFGDKPELSEYNNPHSFFDRINYLVRDNDNELPLLIPFDFIRNIYPDVKFKLSDLPLLQTFEPNHIMHGKVTRPANLPGLKESTRFTDREMEAKVSAAVQRIRKGELLQVVLSMKFPVAGTDAVETLKNFVSNDSSLYVFLYKADNLLIVGSSPENLVTRKKDEMEIFPIAGTVRRSQVAVEDLRLGSELLNSEKDKLEHRMLVDLARNDLGKVSKAGTVKVSDSMILRKYSSVQHLVSRVCSTLSPGMTDLDIITAVFPAGTVSGAPKKRALQIIGEYEERPRGAYSGAIGVIGRKQLDLALLIRSVFSYQGRMETQAGAGIVKDSDPKKEVQEMYDKSLTVTGGLLNAGSNH